jgi:hypothetical protein
MNIYEIDRPKVFSFPKADVFFVAFLKYGQARPGAQTVPAVAH